MTREERIELLYKHIALFKQIEAHWETQEKAYMQCDTASYRFIYHLAEHSCQQVLGARAYEFFIHPSYLNKPNPKPDFYTLGRNEMGEVRADWHCIMETEDFYVDWTAKQYWKSASYPMLIPKQKTMAAACGSL